jgi:tetratricopeptide (TPR) repeat protein
VSRGACLLAIAALLSGADDKPHIKAALAAYDEGKAAEHDKQFQPAINSFRHAIEIEPTFLDAYERLIRVYLDSGQRVQAAAAITQFLEIQPDAVQYRILLGNILLEQKQAERALAQFSLVIKKDPFNADGLLGFAESARQNGMDDRAAQAMKVGRQHYPLDERFRHAP